MYRIRSCRHCGRPVDGNVHVSQQAAERCVWIKLAKHARSSAAYQRERQVQGQSDSHRVGEEGRRRVVQSLSRERIIPPPTRFIPPASIPMLCGIRKPEPPSARATSAGRRPHLLFRARRRTASTGGSTPRSVRVANATPRSTIAVRAAVPSACQRHVVSIRHSCCQFRNAGALDRHLLHVVSSLFDVCHCGGNRGL